MSFPVFIISMVVLTLSLMLGRRQFDDLMRHFHEHHHDAWIQLGKPIGFFWQPEEAVTWAESTQARGKVFWTWMRTSPDWAVDALQWKMRTVRLSVVFSYSGFVISGVALMMSQGG